MNIQTRLPYPGLRAFKRDESDLFFGREGCVDTMIDKLAQTRFLAVLGASGCGKSSLVRTGLFEALEIGFMSGAGSRWNIADIHPGGQPLRNLALGLMRASGGEVDNDLSVNLLRSFLSRGPRAIIEWCRDGHLDKNCNLLILVDQFEELFRYGDYAAREEAEAFVALLMECAAAPDVPIYIVVTMRSEYLSACALLPGLAERINAGLYLTPRMTRDECREAIEGPAGVLGFKVEPALLNRLLNDLAGFSPWESDPGTDQLQRLSRRADQLPLMQHVLNRLWLRAKGQADTQAVVLTLADYEQIGCLQGALDAHATEVVDSLADEQKPLVENLFRALIDGTSLSNAVRRPCMLGELIDLSGGNRAAVSAIIDAFRAADCNFIRPVIPEAVDDGTIIDLSHESLIRQWSQLAEWLNHEARSASYWRRLIAAMEHHAGGEGDLLGGLELANFLAWWRSEQPNAAWAARYGGNFDAAKGFLHASQAAEETLLAAEKLRDSRERKRLQIALGVFVIFTVIVSALGFHAWKSQKEAEIAIAKLNLMKKRNEATLASNDALIKIFSQKNNIASNFPGLQETKTLTAKKQTEFFDKLYKENPNNEEFRAISAHFKGEYGTAIADIGSYEDAVGKLKEAISDIKKYVELHPDDWRKRLELAKQRTELARWFNRATRRGEAIPFVNQAIKELENLLSQPQQRQNTDIIYGLADAYKVKGNASNTWEEGKGDFERSVELAEQIKETYPDKIAVLRLASASKYNIAMTYESRKEYQKTLELLDESEHLLQKALGLEPNSPELLSDSASSYSGRAQLLTLMKRPEEEAKKAWEKSLQLYKKIIANNPKVTRYDWYLADSLKSYASYLSSTGEYDASRKTYEEAIGILENLTQRVDDRPHYGVALVEVLDFLASFHGNEKGKTFPFAPRDNQRWLKALDDMLKTARRIVKKYPKDAKVNFELAKALARRANFEESVTKNDNEALRYYLASLEVFNESTYTGNESKDSSEVAEFLGFAESAIQPAKRLNRIDEVKKINELAYRIGKTHTTMGGIQSLGGTFGTYGSILQKAERYQEAIEAYRKEAEIAEPAWRKAEWNWWLRQEVGGAYRHLGELYQKTNNLPEEIRARQKYLQVWGSPMHGIDSKEYLDIDALLAKPEDVKKLREVTSKDYGMKRFTVPTDFNGLKFPFEVYITNVPWPKDPLEDQARWVEEERGGKIPEDVRESFRKLHKIAHENNVSFIDLAVYALGNTSEKKNQKSAGPRPRGN